MVPFSKFRNYRISIFLPVIGLLAAASFAQQSSVMVSPPRELTVNQGLYSTECSWNSPGLEPLQYLPSGLSGYRSNGCSYSGVDDCVLLPSRHLYISVPPGSEVSFEVEVGGVRVLESGGVRVSRVDTVDGTDVFSAASIDAVPASWGELVDTGIWRRAGVAHVVLHPVIREGTDLLSADRFRVTLSYGNRGGVRPSAVSGREGSIFSALLVGDSHVWRGVRAGRGDSPFQGLPWARITVDTSGVYAIGSSDIPGALGMPSSSLSMFCGRGREMGNAPWDSLYVPCSVQILVEDGNDGTFDEGDRILFFGRGLSWWSATDEVQPPHFMSRYSSGNCYWLTWGGEPGVRMDVIDGDLTGAPQLPGDYIARYHFEQDLVRAHDVSSGNWAWDRASGSTNIWAYHNFDCPHATESGIVEIGLASSKYGNHHVRIQLNGTQLADTTWSGTGEFAVSLPCTGLQPTGNLLAIEFCLDGVGSDTIYLDWFEIFTETEYQGVPGQIEIPLEWLADTGRYRVDWGSDLSGCRVFQLSGDTLCSVIEFSGVTSFEFDIPEDWQRRARGLWIVGENDISTPVSIEECSPGRILGSLTGADIVYVYADFFSSDVDGLNRPGLNRQLVSAQEVYDEFNGGVRDPQAIRGFMNHCIHSWNPIPADLVLVGYGNWDPRQFITGKTSYIDILYTDDGNTVTDDVFCTVTGSNHPQAGVSRICVDSRSDLQLIIERAIDYASGESRGNWQSIVLAAADDERSTKHTGDEVYHTVSMENILDGYVPDALRPRKLYEIFFDWNSQWKKPEARQAYIDAWSDGALLSLFLGHGGYDQLTDEGLLYLEDTGLLACGGRLPVAIFGSCNVGEFQNPVKDCIAQEVTVSPEGGAIIGCGATGETTGFPNEGLISSVLRYMLSDNTLSVSTCLLLGKIENGYPNNDRFYQLFGDGSLELAFPDSSGSYATTQLLTGETAEFSGEGPSEGIMLIRAFESCRPDTYFTFRQHKEIFYLKTGSLFYRGLAPAMPGFHAEAFIPVDADTGSRARIEFFFLGEGEETLAAIYPENLVTGSPSSNDTIGPDIELWVEGFRHESHPIISGKVTVCAALSDPSGINLLGNTGRQLVLYIDDTPQDVSEFFNYYPGSGEAGELEVYIGVLEEGDHCFELRAADGLLNISTEILEATVIQSDCVSLSQVFVYPNPCSDEVSVNWTQTAPGTVTLTIYTLSGRRIASFRNIESSAGYNQIVWNCRDNDSDQVATGTYIYRIQAGYDDASSNDTGVTGIIAVVR